MDPRVHNALRFLLDWSQFDGSHHKAWAIDQVSRLLCGGNPTECGGCVEETDEYKRFVADGCDGEDGPDTYEWDVGIAP